MNRVLGMFIFMVGSVSLVLGQDSIVQKQTLESSLPVAINTKKKDFGTIEKNSKAIFTFEITNLDEKPLVIWHVTTSCGCTSPTWTEKPIEKNKTGNVKVKYDTSQIGKFEKSVFVYTNFNDHPIKLTIEGTVEEKHAKSSKAKSGFTKSEAHFDPNLNLESN